MSTLNAFDKDKRMLAFSAILFAIAISICGYLYFSTRRLEQASANPVPHSSNISEASQKECLAKARKLRDQWEGWAREHKTLLAKMMRADPSDIRTLTE